MAVVWIDPPAWNPEQVLAADTQIKDLAMSPVIINAMGLADDTRAAYSFSKAYDKHARCKAKDYQATKAAERRGRDVNRANSKQVRNQAMHSRRSYKHHAEQMRMDRSIFK